MHQIGQQSTFRILFPTERFERDAISKPTKKALAVAKAKGKMLGNYEPIARAKREATKARAEALRPMTVETLHLSTPAAAHVA